MAGHIMSYAEAMGSRDDEASDFDLDDLRDLETEEETKLRLSLYHEIKEKLVRRGIPAHEIQFIHDFDTPQKKARLLEDVNAGRVRILLGSTGKMGVAMNAQERMIALHHLDAPWRPRDVEQREGRIVRQGNIYDEVFIFQYVTKGSMDCYTWQILESKAKFIHQIMAGEVTQRTAEDIGDMVLTAAQVKAVASGNPKVMERVQLEINLTKLERLRAAYFNNRAEMRYELSYLPRSAAALEREVEWLQQSLAKRQQHAEGEFSIRLKKSYQDTEYTVFDKRQDAGRQLRHLADLALDAVRRASPGNIVHEEVGEYRGFKVFVTATNPLERNFIGGLFGSRVEFELRTEAESRPHCSPVTDTDAGILQSMDYHLRSIDALLAEAVAMKTRTDKKLSDLQGEVSKPWKHLAEYKRMRRRYDNLSSELQSEGIKVEAGVVFGQLSEEELDSADCEAEEGGEEGAAAFSAYADEAGSRNSLTGLETDPIVAPADPRLSPLAASKPEQAVALSAPQSPVAIELVTTEATPPVETPAVRPSEAIVEERVPEQKKSVHPGPAPEAKPVRARKRRLREADPNQLGFGWFTSEASESQQAARS